MRTETAITDDAERAALPSRPQPRIRRLVGPATVSVQGRAPRVRSDASARTNARRGFALLQPPSDPIMTTCQTLARDHGFQPIGSYRLQPDGTVHRAATVPITRRLPLVYAILADEECRYVGKTVQGYSRPLGYHKNDVMTAVRDGIREDLRAGRRVTVVAKIDGLHATHEGLELNLIEAVEHALIRRFDPAWNRQVQALA